MWGVFIFKNRKKHFSNAGAAGLMKSHRVEVGWGGRQKVVVPCDLQSSCYECRDQEQGQAGRAGAATQLKGTVKSLGSHPDDDQVGGGQRGRTIQGCLSYWTSELNILNLGSFWAERLESLCPSRASVSLRLKSVEGILAPGRPGQGGVAGTWTTYKDITIQCPVRIGSKWTGQGMPFQKCLWGGGGWNVQRCHAKWVLWKLCSSLEQKMEFAS